MLTPIKAQRRAIPTVARAVPLTSCPYEAGITKRTAVGAVGVLLCDGSVPGGSIRRDRRRGGCPGRRDRPSRAVSGPKSILVHVDASAAALRRLQLAASLGRAYEAEVTAVYAVASLGAVYPYLYVIGSPESVA